MAPPATNQNLKAATNESASLRLLNTLDSNEVRSLKASSPWRLLAHLQKKITPKGHRISFSKAAQYPHNGKAYILKFAQITKCKCKCKFGKNEFEKDSEV